MSTKLLSKEVIKGLVMREYDNDPRITDELLFRGKRLTMEGYMLLKALYPDKDNYYGSYLDGIAHHCYLVFEFDDNDNSYRHDDSEEIKIVKEKLKPVIERLDQIIGDDECYFISDVVNGERESDLTRGNRSHSWTTHKRYYVIDIWVFGRSGDVMEFANTNDEKCKLLLETL